MSLDMPQLLLVTARLGKLVSEFVIKINSSPFIVNNSVQSSITVAPKSRDGTPEWLETKTLNSRNQHWHTHCSIFPLKS